MVECSLSTLVQPCCMSRLLQRHGRVSDFGPGGLGSIPNQGLGDLHFYLVPNINNPFDELGAHPCLVYRFGEIQGRI